MRSKVLLVTAAVVAIAGGPALARSDEQPAEPRRDGGLHVCCGGSVGYIGGGSGTISGRVRGPSGPGGPGARAATTPVLADPDATTNGKVTPVRLPALAERPLEAKRASISWQLPALLASMAILGAASIAVGYRRRPTEA